MRRSRRRFVNVFWIATVLKPLGGAGRLARETRIKNRLVLKTRRGLDVLPIFSNPRNEHTFDYLMVPIFQSFNFTYLDGALFYDRSGQLARRLQDSQPGLRFKNGNSDQRNLV